MIMLENKTFSAHGKWILTGEHTVMREGSALVFPLPHFHLTAQYQSNDRLIIQGLPDDEEAQKIFKETVVHGCDILGVDATCITGTLTVHNTIPIRAGLGSSAALSVVIGKFLEYVFQPSAIQGSQFYQRIEDKFHLISSGVDIAGVQATDAVYYNRTQRSKSVKVAWRPHLYLSFSEQTAHTYDCIQRVQQLHLKSQSKAHLIDQNMNDSVELCLAGLGSTNPDVGFILLKKGIERAGWCFQQWGIDSMTTLNQLKDLGAVAAKPTGSGKGAYISLWSDIPPASFSGIALF